MNLTLLESTIHTWLQNNLKEQIRSEQSGKTLPQFSHLLAVKLRKFFCMLAMQNND